MRIIHSSVNNSYWLWESYTVPYTIAISCENHTQYRSQLLLVVRIIHSTVHKHTVWPKWRVLAGVYSNHCALKFKAACSNTHRNFSTTNRGTYRSTLLKYVSCCLSWICWIVCQMADMTLSASPWQRWLFWRSLKQTNIPGVYYKSKLNTLTCV